MAISMQRYTYMESRQSYFKFEEVDLRNGEWFITKKFCR